jgi:hypothetical protein
MGAFNRRLDPKEVGGYPMYAAIGLGVGVFGAVVGLFLPGFVKILPLTISAVAFFIAYVAFRLGDQAPFIWIMLYGKYIEPRRVTAETKVSR